MNAADAPSAAPASLMRGDCNSLAYHSRTGKSPGVLFLGGFKSDMTGNKATALDEYCARSGRAFTRFDYFGHGRSSGAFADGTIGRWLDDALAVLDSLTEGPQVVVGSSMGGWIACLLTLARPARVAGLVTVAAAADMTERLILPQLSAAQKAALARDGIFRDPSAYDPQGYEITQQLLDEGRRHLILGGPVPIRCPVRLIHGTADRDVPWSLSAELMDRLESPDATLTLVKDGDHRLSAPADLARLAGAIDELLALA